MRMTGRVAASTGLIFLLLALLVVAEWSPLMKLDSDVLGPATDLARDHDTYRDVMKAATWLLNSLPVVIYAGLIALGLGAAHRPGAAIWLVAVVGVGTVVNALLKQVFDRERPTVPAPVETFDGLSFPSGHAASAALISAAFAVVFWPSLGRAGRTVAAVPVIALPLLSSWTRLTLGGHYLSDVVGGMLWAVAWVAAWQPMLAALERRLSARAALRR